MASPKSSRGSRHARAFLSQSGDHAWQGTLIATEEGKGFKTEVLGDIPDEPKWGNYKV